jgi:hypothetical protein
MGNKSSGRAYKCATDGMNMGGNMGAPNADELPYENACLCNFSRSQRGPGGAFFSSLFILAALCVARRVRRRA